MEGILPDQAETNQVSSKNVTSDKIRYCWQLGR